MRIALLKQMGCRIGRNSYIGPNVTIVSPSKLAIGANVSIHENSYIDAKGGVKIGNNVSIAHQVSIISFNHKFENPKIPIKKQGILLGPIIISDDVWIGCKATILANTIIKHRTVVAAMTLCNKEYSGNEILGGIPAKHIKDI